MDLESQVLLQRVCQLGDRMFLTMCQEDLFGDRVYGIDPIHQRTLSGMSGETIYLDDACPHTVLITQ